MAALDLPHDFSIEGPFDEQAKGGKPNGFRPLGIGWYRKSFVTPGGLDGKRVWLEFEGVYRAPKVWVNGVLVAEKLNGYGGFHCDITPHLKPAGQTNVVAVRADNSLPETSRWYTGGGIYRHVWLHVVSDVHVVLDRIYVTTPKITANEAWVHVQTEVRNASATNRWTTLIERRARPGRQGGGEYEVGGSDPAWRNVHCPPTTHGSDAETVESERTVVVPAGVARWRRRCRDAVWHSRDSDHA